MKCHEFEHWIDRVYSGEATEEEQEMLLDHLDSCHECGETFAALERWRSADMSPEPEEQELRSMRQAVIRQVQSRNLRSPRTRLDLVSLFRHPAAIAVLTTAMLAFGIFLGSLITDGDRKDGDRKEENRDRFIDEIKTVARSHAAYEDIVRSPFTYSNVRLTETMNGMVGITFDVSRHLELSLKKEDPLLTEILVQSLIEPSGVDTRLNAISITPNTRDQKIKKSLIVAMLSDENLAVRMAAQAKLIEQPGDPETVDSLLTVLQEEPSVRMRLLAIEYLANANVLPGQLEHSITAGNAEGIDALLVKASTYLNR